MHHISWAPIAPLLLLLVGAGCARAAPPTAPSVAQVASREPIALRTESREQRAQRVWCEYLDALYRRATSRDVRWSHHEECLHAPSTASPAMLERTATCARRALDGLAGDPFTPAYAEAGRRCGSEALDASALAGPALEPFLQAICKRAETCDSMAYAECRAAIAPRLAARLGRAIGALNDASQARLAACLAHAACDEPMGDRLSGCVEPIMENLLWLPPGKDR
jgi:hypothetical protein